MGNSPVPVKGLGGPEFVLTNPALLDFPTEAVMCPEPGQFHLAEEKINDRARHSKRYKEEQGRLKEWLVVELKPLQLCCKLWEIKCRNGDVNMDLMWWPKDRCDE